MRRVAGAVLTIVGAWSLTIGSATAKPSSDAQQAFAVERAVLNQIATRQAGRAWTHFVPAQQALISKTDYVACRAGSPAVAIRSIVLVNSSRGQVTIPGTTVLTASIALVTRVMLENGAGQTFTARAAKVRKSWRVILGATEFARCHTGSTSTTTRAR